MDFFFIHVSNFVNIYKHSRQSGTRSSAMSAAGGLRQHRYSNISMLFRCLHLNVFFGIPTPFPNPASSEILTNAADWTNMLEIKSNYEIIPSQCQILQNSLAPRILQTSDDSRIETESPLNPIALFSLLFCLFALFFLLFCLFVCLFFVLEILPHKHY